MTIRVALEHRTTYQFDRLVGIGPHVVRLGRYVTTAWGRDYSDVPPLKGGVIFTESTKHVLQVHVDVALVGPPVTDR